MSEHAKLSPSAASRWMSCPGSVVLSEGMPEKSSVFSEEGTLAHSLGEKWLREMQRPEGDAEMLDAVKVYVDDVLDTFRQGGGNAVMHLEQRVYVNDDVHGTADCTLWLPAQKHLHVKDYKHGAGVPVEVHDNLQLRIYALAALLTFKYPAHQVTATIVQPRCPHSAGPVRSVTFDVVDLLDFHAELADAVERVRKAHSPVNGPLSHWLNPTEKGCRWCLAAPKCPAIKSKAQAMAKQVFSPGLPYDPLELARTLDFLPIVEGWIKNTREFAYAEAERGHDIPDYKLVEKRASRKWRDENFAIGRLSLHLSVGDVYKPPELRSVTDIEKLLPKEQRGLLDELTVKESSGHVLAHASDKRPAIKVDAKSAFANT